MNTKILHIFKSGTHTAMSGVALSFSESDLAASAKAYDPAVHEAPLVVGHPSADAPAYGWVKSLAFAENGLQAVPNQVDPAFAELVNAGRYKKISASFYTPSSPSNPVPGVWYLRHVGFLGAQPPAVKGLQSASFADDSDFVEFADWDDLQNASLWRNMREWLIGRFGQDDADRVVPSYTVQQLEQSALTEATADSDGEADNELPNPAFSDPQPTFNTPMTEAEKHRLAELEAENARLKSQNADFAEQQKTAKTQAIHAENTAFAEQLVKDGKLLPFMKEAVISTLNFMAGQEQVVEFGEGTAKKSLLEALKNDVLNKLPNLVQFGEQYAHDGDSDIAVNFAAPTGAVVNQTAALIDAKAKSYQAKHGGDYLDAVRAVGGMS